MTLPASHEAREANSRITKNEQLRIKLRILENEMWLDDLRSFCHASPL